MADALGEEDEDEISGAEDACRQIGFRFFKRRGERSSMATRARKYHGQYNCQIQITDEWQSTLGADDESGRSIGRLLRFPARISIPG